MFFQHSIGLSKVCDAEHHCSAKTRQSRITLFSLVLVICCSIASDALACPYCGFVIKTNAVVSSTLYAVIIFLFGIFLIKLFPKLSCLSNVRTIFVVLLFSLLVGVLFYRWPNLRPFDIFPYERMRQLSRPLDDICVYVLVIIITLPALWLRVVRDEGWLYRFVLGLVGLAIPVFWLLTLLRYMIVSPTYPDVLARNMVMIWLVVAVLSTVPHLFSLVCAILAGCIFLAFFISGAFDTTSFIFISAILVVILITIFVLFIRKASTGSNGLDPKNESGPITVWNNGDRCKLVWKRIQYVHDFSIEKSIEDAYEKVKKFFSERKGTIIIDNKPNELVIERPFSFCLAIRSEKGFFHNIKITLSENDGLVVISCFYDAKTYPDILVRPMYFETEAGKLEWFLKDKKEI